MVTTKLSDPAAGDDDGEHGVDEGDNAKDTTQRETAEEVLLSQVTEEAIYGSQWQWRRGCLSQCGH